MSKPKRDGDRPQIWADGSQRPRFNPRAFLRASLFFGRESIAAPATGWLATILRRVAGNIANGVGRIPEAKLGRAARLVPSHLRVAAWVQNLAATLAHASATADPDVPRGNALVAAIERPLWPSAPKDAPVTPPSAVTGPVTLPEPEPDPTLRAIRAELAATEQQSIDAPADSPPAPPGAVAKGAIQVLGFVAGWGFSLAAFPAGLVLALIHHLKGEDLRKIGQED